MENKSLLQVLAEGVANTNKNVVAVFDELQDIKRQIGEIHAALYAANEGGGEENVKPSKPSEQGGS
jgi:hypothetical protein